MQGSILSSASFQGVNLALANMHGVSAAKAQFQGADLSRTNLQGADLEEAHLQGVTSHEEFIFSSSQAGWLRFPDANSLAQNINSFEERIGILIGTQCDLHGTIFEGGLSREDLEAPVEGFSDKRAKELRAKLEPHIGKPSSNKLPEDYGPITGFYTAEEAEQWIAEY